MIPKSRLDSSVTATAPNRFFVIVNSTSSNVWFVFTVTSFSCFVHKSADVTRSFFPNVPLDEIMQNLFLKID